MVHILKNLENCDVEATIKNFAVGTQYDKFANCILIQNTQDLIIPLNQPKRNAIQGLFEIATQSDVQIENSCISEILRYLEYNVLEKIESTAKNYNLEAAINTHNGLRSYLDYISTTPCYVPYVSISDYTYHDYDYDKHQPEVKYQPIKFLTVEVTIDDYVTDKVVALLIHNCEGTLDYYDGERNSDTLDILYRVQNMELTNQPFIKTLRSGTLEEALQPNNSNEQFESNQKNTVVCYAI